MKSLQGKIVAVTGASRGLGLELACAFAVEGCRVAMAARDQRPLHDAAEKIAALGGATLAFACDVTHREEVEKFAERITTVWEPAQILINNAGIARAMRFLDMPDELWHEILAVNLTGAYNCCKVFLPAMIQSKWGRIINIASTTAKIGYPHASAYTASKHGLLGLTRSLALETAQAGVTVNAICPGYLDDERTRDNACVMAEKTGKTVDDIIKLFAASGPQNRLIAPAEIASLAVLIASERLGGMTGQAVNVDGGAVMI
jgi:NAD(P)-dependent dehydrogenase (short-subunit alcohol dehydrogenase family)